MKYLKRRRDVSIISINNRGINIIVIDEKKKLRKIYHSRSTFLLGMAIPERKRELTYMSHLGTFILCSYLYSCARLLPKHYYCL